MRRISALLVLLPFFSIGQTIDYVPLHTATTFDAVTIDVSKPVGSTSGQAGVSPTGGATYAIPVYTPPGTNGVVPSVSLEYNSQSGPGIAGMGWHLSGMSAISRVPQNVYFDGQVRPVGLNADDRFALDGQRLVLKTGTYGATGSTYGTEVENFATVTLHAVPSSSLTWLEVITKEGIQMEYGRTADSRFLNEAETVVIFWALNRVVHPDGNYIAYQYTATGREEPRLTKILYTGNLITEDPTYNEIQFDYKIRQDGGFSDIRTVYIGGSEIVSRFLLDKITVKAEAATVRTYQLTYGHDEVNSYLKSVQEGNGAGATLNPTAFKYGELPPLSGIATNSIPSVNNIISFSGDYDGDGIPDILSGSTTQQNGLTIITQFRTWKRNPETGQINIMAEQDLPLTSTYFYFNRDVPGVKQPYTSDINGDGLSDVSVFALQFVEAGNYTRVDHILHYLSNPAGNTFSQQVQSTPVVGSLVYNRIPDSGKFMIEGDFDGDGQTEQLLKLGNPSASEFKLFYVDHVGAFPTYYEINNSAIFNTFDSSDDFRIADFNGDGAQDLFIFVGDYVEIFSFDALGQATSLYYSYSFPQSTPSNYFHLGDFNGDGKMDVLQVSGDFSSIIKGISTGTGFVQEAVVLNDSWSEHSTALVEGFFVLGDYNGDGKSDIYHFWRAKGDPDPNEDLINVTEGRDLYLFSGSKFVHRQVDFEFYTEPDAEGRPAGPPTINFPTDFNGDGRTNIATGSGNFVLVRSFNINGQDNLLTRVKTGSGHTSEWEYKKITDGGDFYARGIFAGGYPLNKITPVFNAVSSVKVPDGVGGQREVSYAYAEAFLHRTGKGFLGFTKVTGTDLSSGIRTESQNQFNLDYYVALPQLTRQSSTVDDQYIGYSTFSHTLEPAGPKRFWLKTTSIAETDALSGVTTTTGLVYDAYANVTQQTVTIPGVHTSVTDTEFGAYPSGIPNKPTLVTVTQTRGTETPFETKTKLDYNGLGQLTSKIDFYQQAKAVTTAFGYNGLGNQTSVTVSATDIPSRSTGAVYDDKGRYPLQTTNALSQPSTATYDPKWGTPLTVTGVDGRTTTHQYDTWGRLTKTTFPEGYETDATLHWDVSGQQRFYAQSVTAGMPTTRTWYDLLGREIRTETEGFNGTLSSQTRSYDARGNVHVASEPHYNSEPHNTTTHLYDAYNRISSAEHSALGTTGYGYSYASGQLTVTTTSPAGTSSQTTDAAGMLTSATDHGGTLNYTYYSHGGLKTVSNGATNLTTSEYDNYGRQTKLIDVNAGTTEYAYDALGQLIWQKTAGNDETTMAYNLLGQVTTRTGVEGITTYAYGTDNGSGDIKNRIKTVTGFAGTSTAYTYNALGQLTQLTEHHNGAHTTGYTYNAVGDISTVSYPSGLVITNQYNERGYLDEIKQGGTTLYKTEATNGQGQVTQYKRQNNLLTSTIGYTNSFPTAYTTAGIQDYQLTWDYQKGTLTSRQDARTAVNKTETFTYDNLQRLTGASVSGGAAISATYHAGGNLNTKTDAGVYTYHPTKIHAVTGVTNPAPAPIPTLQQDITYTPFLQPETVEEGDFELIYTYGADYNRAKSELKQSGSTINTRYYYEAGYERDITGSTTRYIHYIVSPAGLIAIVESVGGNHTVHYTYTDHLGSILTVTDDGGNIEAEQSFDAWGRRRNPSNWALLLPTASTSLPVWLYRGYTSHEHLDQFGLINMNGRMYDPVLGRMLSPDNYVPDALFTQDYNRYTYARNNPLVYTDPDGEWVHLAIGAVLGGISGWQIGKAQGAKGWAMAGYIVAGAGIGVVSAGMAETIAGSMLATSSALGASVGAYATAGAVSGAFSGTAFTALAGGNIGRGALMGGLLGGATGALGGYLSYQSAGMAMKRSVGDRRFWVAFNDIGDEELKRIAEGTILLDYVHVHAYLPSGAITPSYTIEEFFIGGVVLKGFSRFASWAIASRMAANKGFNVIAAYRHAISPYKGGSFTNAGRAVTKHPEYFGFESTEALMKAYRSPESLNKLGSSAVKEILRSGIKTTGKGGRYPSGWVTYTLQSGKAASWNLDGTFIGFRGIK